MSRKATTFRIEQKAVEGLALLTGMLGRSQNQLVNEAILEFVERRSIDIEHDLRGTLARLRAWRERDPDMEAAIGRFAEAEVSEADDPAQGEPATAPDPLIGKLHKLLDA